MPVVRSGVTPVPVTFDSVIVNEWSASGSASGQTWTVTFFTVARAGNVTVPESLLPNSPPPVFLALYVAEPGVMA